MDLTLDTLTLAALLTTAGAATLAAIVTGLVSIIGRLFVVGGNEARLAALITFAFVLLLSVQAVLSGSIVVGVPLILGAVIAWYSVTRLAMSIYDDITDQPDSFRHQA